MPIRSLSSLRNTRLRLYAPSRILLMTCVQQRRPSVYTYFQFSTLKPILKEQRSTPPPSPSDIPGASKTQGEGMTLQLPKDSRDYREIEPSLSNPYLRSNAPWGFIVVRAVYGPSSDAPWSRMIETLRSRVASALKTDDQNDLLPRFEMTILEDEATLAGADSYAVRRAFRAWVAKDLPARLCDNYLEKYGGAEQIRAKLLSNDTHLIDHPIDDVPPRWKYCTFVDEACLRSLISWNGPALKILTSDWVQESPGAPTEEFTVDWDGGETDDSLEDVGWMFLDMYDYVFMYDVLATPNLWQVYYDRPYKSYVDH